MPRFHPKHRQAHSKTARQTRFFPRFDVVCFALQNTVSLNHDGTLIRPCQTRKGLDQILERQAEKGFRRSCARHCPYCAR
ncbi:MAG: hypothetical protein ACJAVM_003382 [Sulfitobacter sp.]|jgi:hypothetical protein